MNSDHNHRGLESNILLKAGSQQSQRAKGKGSEDARERTCLMYLLFLDEFKLRVINQKGQVFGSLGDSCVWVPTGSSSDGLSKVHLAEQRWLPWSWWVGQA